MQPLSRDQVRQQVQEFKETLSAAVAEYTAASAGSLLYVSPTRSSASGFLPNRSLPTLPVLPPAPLMMSPAFLMHFSFSPPSECTGRYCQSRMPKIMQLSNDTVAVRMLSALVIIS